MNSGYLDWEQECGTCKQSFTEKSNLGWWKCTCHLGKLEYRIFKDVEDAVPVWSCCNTSPTARVFCITVQQMKRNPLYKRKGCTACDHFATEDGPSIIDIPEQQWDNSWILLLKEDINKNIVRPGLIRMNKTKDCSSLIIRRISTKSQKKDDPGQYLFKKLHEQQMEREQHLLKYFLNTA